MFILITYGKAYVCMYVRGWMQQLQKSHFTEKKIFKLSYNNMMCTKGAS